MTVVFCCIAGALLFNIGFMLGALWELRVLGQKVTDSIKRGRGRHAEGREIPEYDPAKYDEMFQEMMTVEFLRVDFDSGYPEENDE